MRGVVDILAAGSQATSYLLGAVILVAAGTTAIWSLEPGAIAGWAFDVLGTGFIAMLALLVLGTIYCAVKLVQNRADRESADFWLTTGVQLAGGVATLALTYTLLGISLGIGSLAGQGLTSENVQVVIRDLTANFSLAFMTTVIGLPMSAGLRTLLVIVHGKQRLQRRADIRIEQE